MKKNFLKISPFLKIRIVPRIYEHKARLKVDLTGELLNRRTLKQIREITDDESAILMRSLAGLHSTHVFINYN